MIVGVSKEVKNKEDRVALVPSGAEAPILVTREMLQSMKRGAVVVDVAVDQGGCFETTHPTTHSGRVGLSHIAEQFGYPYTRAEALAAE